MRKALVRALAVETHENWLATSLAEQEEGAAASGMITPKPGPVWPPARHRQDRFARAFGGGLRGAPASLDRGCARRPLRTQVGTEKRCFDRTKNLTVDAETNRTNRVQLANVTVTIPGE